MQQPPQEIIARYEEIQALATMIVDLDEQRIVLEIQRQDLCIALRAMARRDVVQAVLDTGAFARVKENPGAFHRVELEAMALQTTEVYALLQSNEERRAEAFKDLQRAHRLLYPYDVPEVEVRTMLAQALRNVGRESEANQVSQGDL